MSLKKTNGVGLKKGKHNTRLYVHVHKSYTNDRKLGMIIVKDQWTAILANFVKSLQIPDLFYLCNDRQGQEKLASLILYTKHLLKSTYKITLLFTSNRIATHSFRVNTITLKSCSGNSCNLSFFWNQIACCFRFL